MTQSPKDRSREMSKRMKKDIVNYYAGKIAHVLRFSSRVGKPRDRGLLMSETYKNKAGHGSHPGDA